MVVKGGPGAGFTTLDGGALVLGASVAAVPMRHLVAGGHPGLFGWSLFWLAFTGLAVTAAGPFVFLVRSSIRRVADYPRMGDWLWTLLGMPWVLTAPFCRRAASRSMPPGPPGNPPDPAGLYALALWLLLLVACGASILVVWRTWVLEPGLRPADEPRPALAWTERIGLTLAVAWPIQCGFGLLVTG